MLEKILETTHELNMRKGEREIQQQERRGAVRTGCWKPTIENTRNNWRTQEEKQQSDVLLVERLTANLISISQLCDDGMQVYFNKDGCTVNNSCDQTFMKGVRSDNNCYMWTSVKARLSKKSEDAELWHKKLRNPNYRNIQQLITIEVVQGFPLLEIKYRVCGEYQVGKYTKGCDQKLQQVITTRILELMHMDLMGHMNNKPLSVFNKWIKVVMEFMNMKVLDQGMETCEEDADVGITITNNSPEWTSMVMDGTDVDDSCDNICSIQLASIIQKNHESQQE
ncbi:hypothetical protein LIER_36643 [Lithospermum erythrorhizon]|uniref:GAG-pre-integrase domain-containing protein n=1 Tax=Lithospermum erythrorhizon TaxID=34254 RepID=A0AAV3PAT6_LITER